VSRERLQCVREAGRLDGAVINGAKQALRSQRDEEGAVA
jgi:hypothetical protein